VKQVTTDNLFNLLCQLFQLGTLVAVLLKFIVLLIVVELHSSNRAECLATSNALLVLFCFRLKKRSGNGVIGLAMNICASEGPTFFRMVVTKTMNGTGYFISFTFAGLDVLVLFCLKNVGEIGRPKQIGFSVIYSTIGIGGLVFGFSNASFTSVLQL